jgi:hypothetical protein
MPAIVSPRGPRVSSDLIGSGLMQAFQGREFLNVNPGYPALRILQQALRAGYPTLESHTFDLSYRKERGTLG